MIPKHTQLSPPEYAKLHRDLRKRLERIAFDQYYACARCGSHQNLEVHIPNPDLRLQDQPGFFTILCKSCHRSC